MMVYLRPEDTLSAHLYWLNNIVGEREGALRLKQHVARWNDDVGGAAGHALDSRKELSAR